MQVLIDKTHIELFEKKLKVKQVFYMPIPKSLSKKKQEELDGKYCDVGGDLDNLLKSVWDSLNKIAFNDDKQIVSSSEEKYYSTKPRIEITIEEIE